MEENRNKENRNVENRNEENRNEEKKAAGQNIQTIEEKTEDASSGDIRDSQPSKRSYKRRRERYKRRKKKRKRRAPRKRREVNRRQRHRSLLTLHIPNFRLIMIL